MRAEPWVRAQTALLSREGFREGAKARSVAWSRSQREVELEEKNKKVDGRYAGVLLWV